MTDEPKPEGAIPLDIRVRLAAGAAMFDALVRSMDGTDGTVLKAIEQITEMSPDDISMTLIGGLVIAQDLRAKLEAKS